MAKSVFFILGLVLTSLCAGNTKPLAIPKGNQQLLFSYGKLIIKYWLLASLELECQDCVFLGDKFGKFSNPVYNQTHFKCIKSDLEFLVLGTTFESYITAWSDCKEFVAIKNSTLFIISNSTNSQTRSHTKTYVCYGLIAGILLVLSSLLMLFLVYLGLKIYIEKILN